MLRNSIFFLATTSMLGITQGADAPVDSSKNTYSITLENLQSGEKSIITVSGPAGSEQSQTKDLAERLARDAFNGDASNQMTKKESGKFTNGFKADYLNDFDGVSVSKYLLPRDYVYILPGYSSNGSLGHQASVPGYATDPLKSLLDENAKLKEVIKLQGDQIKLLQDELSLLQGK